MSKDKQTYIDLDDVDPTAETEPPEIVGFRFRFGEELARGGLGRVNEGYDHTLDREVAIKSLLQEHPGSQARFDREMLLTARLQHPNIVPVYDGGTDPEGRRYLAMRLVHGRSLEQAIEEAGPELDRRLVLLPHVIAACNAIAYAHHERITHRDIKPDNILVGAFGETVVIDWGLAKDLDTADEPTFSDVPPVDPQSARSGRSSRSGGASLTRVGSVMGTPAYMPPEQASGLPVDERADVYALGAVLYHVLTAHRPYDGEDDVLAAVVAGPPVPVESKITNVPRDLVAVVAKAMSRRPEDRYPDARALAEELEAFEAGARVNAYDYSRSERIVRWIRAHPLPTALSVILIITITIAIVGLTRANRIANEQRQEVAVLERVQRARADSITLEHARTFARSDPTRSLLLLDSLSEGMPFDGAVHSVASAAVNSQPARRIFDTGPGHAIHGAGDAAGLLVSSGRRVLHFGTALRNPEEHLLPEPVVALAQEGSIHLACTADALYPLGEAPVALPVPCLSLGSTEAGVVVRGPEGWLALWDGEALVELGELGEPNRRLYVRRNALWRATPDELIEHAIEPGLREKRRVLAPTSSLYAQAENGAGAVAFFGSPALTIVEPGRLRGHQPNIDAKWLSSGAWLTEDLLLGGGDSHLLWVIPRDPATEVTVLPIEGRPVHMAAMEGRVAIATDAGRLFVATVQSEEVQLRELGASDDLVSSLQTGPDGHVAWVGQQSVSVQHTEPADGRLVHNFGRAAQLIPTPRGVVGRSWEGGAVLIHPDGRTEQLMEEGNYGVTGCGGRLWLATSEVLRSEGLADVTPPWTPAALFCAANGRFALGVETGKVFYFDPRTGEVLEDIELPGVSVRAGFEVEPYGEGLLVFSHQVWELQGPGTPPVRHFPELTEGFSGALVNGRLVVGTADHRVLTEDGRVLATTNGTVTTVAGVGEQLVTGGVYGTVSRWADLDGPIEVLKGHRQYVHDLAPHPGGRWVASTGWDDTAWIWDLSTTPASGRPLEAHQAAVIDAEWSLDGSRLYTSDRSGAVRAWRHDLPTDPDALREFVHDQATSLAAGR